MKVLVCGGRTYANRSMLNKVLSDLHATQPFTLLIHGGAKGADLLAMEWAVRNSVDSRSFPADWDTHGPAAGPIRNSQMIAEQPDLVVAFQGGRGTQDTVTKARAAGIEVHQIS